MYCSLVLLQLHDSVHIRKKLAQKAYNSFFSSKSGDKKEDKLQGTEKPLPKIACTGSFPNSYDEGIEMAAQYMPLDKSVKFHFVKDSSGTKIFSNNCRKLVELGKGGGSPARCDECQAVFLDWKYLF